MANYSSFRDGGKTSEIGITRQFSSNYYAEDGVAKTGHLLVSERGAGANASVDIAAGDVIFFEGSTHARIGFIDATVNAAITANASGNPRIDAVSVYFDESVVDSTNSDNPGTVLTKVTAGTAAASPVPPTDAEIQADVGAGNSFIRLADVDVANGFSAINDEEIEDRRTFAQSQEFVTRDYNSLPERVISGLLFAVPGSGLAATMSTGSAYVRGYYIAYENNASESNDKTFTASKDTYVDLSYSPTNGEKLTFTEVANGAAEPAVASNSIRLCKVVTDATDVTSVSDLRNMYAEGEVQSTGAVALTTSFQNMTGLTATFEVSQVSYLMVQHSIRVESGTTNADIYETQVDLDSGTQVGSAIWGQEVAGARRFSMVGSGLSTLSAAQHTINGQARNATAARGTGSKDSTASFMRWRIAPTLANYV